MKRFLGHFFLSALFFISICYLISLPLQNWRDAMLVKLNSSPHSSLIIGQSRAGQSLIPDSLQRHYPELLNYAFTNQTSPYGPVYLNAIKKKLSETNEAGLFIISVNPGAVSVRSPKIHDPKQFREAQGLLARTYTFNNLNPIEYVVRMANRRPLEILLESMGFTDRSNPAPGSKGRDIKWVYPRAEAENFSKQKLKKNIKLKFYPSSLRMQYLVELIDYLNKRGQVFLVRLPSQPDLKNWEDRIDPQFDEKIKLICKPRGLRYINFNEVGADFKFRDFSHLSELEAPRISKMLADSIFGVQPAPSLD